MGSRDLRPFAARFIAVCALVLSTLGLLPASAYAATPSPNPVPDARSSGGIATTATTAPIPTPFPRVQLADGREAVADRVIVAFQPGVSDAEKAAVQQTVSQRSRAAVPNPVPLRRVGGAQVVDVSGTASLDAALQAYRADPRVLYAEPDYIARTTETPNDPGFPQQYGMTKIQAPDAWNVTHGKATIKIAILDCGIYEAHPDLAGKVVAESDQVPPDENPFWNTANYSGTNDLCNHGTHVAGIASADTGNGAGVAGVGYDTALMNGKVLLENRDANGNLTDGGSGSVTGIVNGIAWATANGANVINMSLGGGGACPFTMQSAIDDAWAHNVVVVAAAGNDGLNESFFPADCSHVVSVASTDATDARSSFSNYGPGVTVAAPGSSIYSTINPQIPENAGNSYGTKSGTSMATPHVAGLAGLLWATPWGTSAQAVVDRLTGTGDRFTDSTTGWSYRRINAATAVTGPATVTALNPPSVYAGGAGFTLSVLGNSFGAGAQVLWNGKPRVTNFVSAQQLTITVTATDIQSPTTIAIAVRNADGFTSASISLSVTVSPVPLEIRTATPSASAPGNSPSLRSASRSGSSSSSTPAPMPLPRSRP